MNLGILTLEVYLSSSGSLKEKRMVLKSLKDKLRRNFNVSIAELDEQDKWQRAILGIVLIGNERVFLDQQLSSILDYIDKFKSLEIINHEVELL